MIAETRSLLKDNRGVAMIYSLVIGIVVAIFAVMLLLVTYSLYAQSSRQVGQTQCRIMADSFIESLTSELVDEDSDLHEYVCKRYRGEIEPQWISCSDDAAAILELNYQPNDINYEIRIRMSYDAVENSGDDGDDGLIDDDNDPDGIEGGAVVPTPTISPTPGGTPILSDEIIINVEVTCYKGGVQGVGVQSYTAIQKCKVEMNEDDD